MNLSIIIPCFNCCNNIYELLSNIYQQIKKAPPKFKIEVIIIDDGSTDSTYNEIMRFLANNDGYIFDFLSIQNIGAAKVRELGLRKAKGEYIFFCDSDDYVSDFFIKTIMRHLNKKPDMVFFSTIIQNESSNIKKYKTYYSDINIIHEPQSFLLQSLKSNNWTSAVWTYIFKSRLVTEQVLFTHRSAHEDHLFTLGLIHNSKNIITIPDVLYIQKLASDSLTRSKKEPVYIMDRLHAYQEVKAKYYKQWRAEVNHLYSLWSLNSILSIVFSEYFPSMRSRIIIIIRILYNEPAFLGVSLMKILSKLHRFTKNDRG